MKRSERKSIGEEIKGFILDDLNVFLHILFQNYYGIKCKDLNVPGRLQVEVLKSDGTAFKMVIDEVEKSIAARKIIRACEIELNRFDF